MLPTPCTPQTRAPRACVRRPKTASGIFLRSCKNRARKTCVKPLKPRQVAEVAAEETASGVRYYGYRYLDTFTGRWLSRDPIKERGGINIYRMTGNDAVNRIDILGLLPDIEFNTLDLAVAAAAKAIYEKNLENIPTEHRQHFTTEVAFQKHKADVLARIIPDELKGIPFGPERTDLYQARQKKYFGYEIAGVVGRVTKPSGSPHVVWVIEYTTNFALSYVDFFPAMEQLEKKYEKLYGKGCVELEAKLHNHPTGGPASPRDMENKGQIKNYIIQPWGSYSEY